MQLYRVTASNGATHLIYSDSLLDAIKNCVFKEGYIQMVEKLDDIPSN